MANSIENNKESINLILLEDENELAKKIKSNLVAEGFNVTHTLNISSFIEDIQKNQYSLAILDRLINEEDSLSYFNQIKQYLPNSQFLILSAIDSPFEKANCLNLGVDDYLSKPFEMVELIARLKKLKTKHNTPNSIYKISNVKLDLIKQEAFIDDKNLLLSTKEFGVLKTIAMSPNKIFTKEMLLTSIWNFSTSTDTNVIESTINGLRRKLEFGNANVKIKNKRFVGYWLEK